MAEEGFGNSLASTVTWSFTWRSRVAMLRAAQERARSSSTPPAGHLRNTLYCSALNLNSSCLFSFVVLRYGVCQITPPALAKKRIKKKGILN